MTDQQTKTYTVDGKEYDTIWAALAAPLRPDQIQVLDGQQTGKKIDIPYCEAETIIQRLNDLVPGEWEFDFEPIPYAGYVDGTLPFKGKLTIQGVTRCDVGIGEPLYNSKGEADLTAYGGPPKKAWADAMKRTARLFGIGLELWTDPKGCLRKAAGQNGHRPEAASPPVGSGTPGKKPGGQATKKKVPAPAKANGKEPEKWQLTNAGQALRAAQCEKYGVDESDLLHAIDMQVEKLVTVWDDVPVDSEMACQLWAKWDFQADKVKGVASGDDQTTDEFFDDLKEKATSKKASDIAAELSRDEETPFGAMDYFNLATELGVEADEARRILGDMERTETNLKAAAEKLRIRRREKLEAAALYNALKKAREQHGHWDGRKQLELSDGKHWLWGEKPNQTGVEAALWISRCGETEPRTPGGYVKSDGSWRLSDVPVKAVNDLMDLEKAADQLELTHAEDAFWEHVEMHQKSGDEGGVFLIGERLAEEARKVGLPEAWYAAIEKLPEKVKA